MDITPIWLREKDQSKQANILFFHKLHCGPEFLRAAEATLKITLENGLTQVKERRAVWFYFEILQNNRVLQTFHSRIGTTFPDFEFEKRCWEFSREKVFRTRQHPEHVCSHQSRNPAESKWGGSAKLVFNLNMGNLGLVEGMTFEGACSAFKEWEDLGQFLAPFYYLELIRFKDQQVQEILSQADESVKDDPTGRPEGMTITEYVIKLFAAIDSDLGR